MDEIAIYTQNWYADYFRNFQFYVPKLEQNRCTEPFKTVQADNDKNVAKWDARKSIGINISSDAGKFYNIR